MLKSNCKATIILEIHFAGGGFQGALTRIIFAQNRSLYQVQNYVSANAWTLSGEVKLQSSEERNFDPP